MTDINTKDFWLDVQQEYKPTTHDYFVCNHSKTFSEAWYYTDFSNEYVIRDQIVELSEEFARLINKLDTTRVSDLLFCTLDQKERSQLRLDFITFCINKFQ